MQKNTALESITINAKLSLVEFRDGETTFLDLSRKGYGNEEAIIIGALLQVPYFHAFRLQLTPVSTAPANRVFPFDFRQKNTAVTSVDLGWNKIGNEGAVALAKMLKVGLNPC